MTPLLAVGLSVLLHVSWNLLTRRTHSDANFLWWIVGLHVLIFAPLALPAFLHAAQDSPVLYLCAAISGIANGLYFLGLRAAYHVAPASAVYPMVRSSPLLIAVIETLFFARDFPLLSWFAILVAAGGLWLIATSSHDGVRRLSKAWPYALFAAVMTTVYSLSDKVAAGHLDGLHVALGYVCVNYAIGWLFLCGEQKRRTQRWVPAITPSKRSLLIGALGVGTAYALVIYAMRWLPAAYAVTLTNAGIVLTVLLGIVWLKEHEGWRQRVAGAALVVVGLVGVGVLSA
ncbi:MAG: EamA family transporter [Gammaproteobacteria bacterium]|jgi:phosphonate utilization associated putative membrane protein|nr:EamA family transporter [Gammaproteobacteria bacterium]MBU1624818.1 EamA family transporter [Gammaproteobacteria bacterium]MBU1982662.1 EamA family transporter [Gammaproteobacteria bacterium]